jgi:hypothetical protein
MSFGKFLVLLLLSCTQMTASLAVRAASDNSVTLVQGNLEPLTRNVPCQTAEFGYFFRVFVRGLDDRLPRSAVRSAYVWPQVEVRSYRNPNKLLATVSKQEYANDFKIGLLYNRWIYLDPQAANYSEPPPRLDVKFQTLDRDRIRVEYRQAEYAPTPNAGKDSERLVKTFGEPGAYIFEHRVGCWRLTQELRPG